MGFWPKRKESLEVPMLEAQVDDLFMTCKALQLQARRQTEAIALLVGELSPRLSALEMATLNNKLKRIWDTDESNTSMESVHRTSDVNVP